MSAHTQCVRARMISLCIAAMHTNEIPEVIPTYRCMAAQGFLPADLHAYLNKKQSLSKYAQQIRLCSWHLVLILPKLIGYIGRNVTRQILPQKHKALGSSLGTYIWYMQTWRV